MELKARKDEEGIYTKSKASTERDGERIYFLDSMALYGTIKICFLRGLKGPCE